MPTKLIDPEMSGYGSTAGTAPVKTEWQKFLESQLGGGSGGAGSAGSPTAYMGQAQNMLGNLDLSGFAALQKALQSQYATGSQGLENSYQNLLASLATKGTENKQQFAKARGTIAENSFERGRDQFRALASRGLGASGLQQLGEVQNRMQTGREVSGVANQFYDTSAQLAETEKQGQQGYETQKKSLADSLAAGQASLNQQQIQYKSAYQQNLANLAMQLQSQKQAQLNASASAAASNRNYQASISGELAKLKDQNATSAAGGDKYAADKYAIAAADIPESQKIAELQSKVGLTPTQAKNYLNEFVQTAAAEKIKPAYDAVAKDIAAKTIKTNAQFTAKIKELEAKGYEFTPEQKATLSYLLPPDTNSVRNTPASLYAGGGGVNNGIDWSKVGGARGQ